MNEEPVRPIFYDPTARRAGHLQISALLVSIVLAALLVLFCASVFVVPMAHRLRLSAPKYLPDTGLHGANVATSAPEAPVRVIPRRGKKELAPHTVPGKADGVVGGFYVSWDQASLSSLREHAGDMTHLFPGWLHIDSTGNTLRITDSDPTDTEARALALKNNVRIVPLVNNFDTTTNEFDEARLHKLLQSPKNRGAVEHALLAYVLKNNYAGVNLDFETQDEDDRAALSAFTDELGALFHPHNLLVTACTQVDGDPKQTVAIARSCDFIVPMVYDLHWNGGEAGAIAPRHWAEQQLDTLLRIVPANKMVLAVGNYAYDWERGKTGAKSLTFGEAMVTAQESLDSDHASDNGIVKWDATSQNPRFSYEEDGVQHEVWLMDATTAYNLQRYAEKRGITGHALWYVGSEDPSLWTFFAKGKRTGSPDLLRTAKYGFELAFEGEGEVLDVTTLPQVGQRTIHADSDGYIRGEVFTKYPTACVVRRSGHAAKKIALTFDDGPDPRWTPGVLDALAAAHAPATFFVCGVNAQQHPELVRREWDEGHLIGNHSFYHPNLAAVPATRARLEISATERAIQAATLHTTTLFRPPYGIDTEPSTTQEIVPLIEAEKLGYVTVGEGIDPRDWQNGKGKQTAEQIAANVIKEAEEGNGNVVLLHDSGGDRAETVRAIPLIVQGLREHGFEIVGLDTLIGDSHAKVMPVVRGKERYVAYLDRVVFFLSAQSGNLLAGLFLVSLVAGTIRMAFTAALAVVHAERQKRQPVRETGILPTVSVVIAAYNEEKVVTRTIQALLDGGYPHLEVIVVDDGSKDDTSGVVQRAYADEPRVRLITKPNGGKASALNLGIAEATGSILIGLDADTLFAPDTVQRLVRHFADDSVGAVAGNILVGNRINLLTRWQAVEYTTSQNFDRRAYDVMNAIPVVPGCVGAWRREAVIAAGLYQRDTLAEDADLTWRVRKLGWRIVSDNTALAFTEAPDRLTDLMKQRFRWTFGTLQVLWKHRDVFANPKYGYFGCVVIPCLWLFQILLPLAAPAADLGILATVFSKNWVAVFAYGGFFFATELAAAYLAFALDGADASRRKDLLLLFVQRFVYRYVMFLVLLKATLAALQGIRAGWGKLDRRGTAKVAAP